MACVTSFLILAKHFAPVKRALAHRALNLMTPFTFVDLPTVGRVSRDREPNICPHCAHKIVPEELVWSISGAYNAVAPTLDCTYRCSNDECKHAFIACYELSEWQADTDAERVVQAFGGRKCFFKLSSTWPRLLTKTTIASEVSALSHQFIEIFGQAEEAEAYGLIEICGLGYRKSLEFLIKDFCISEHPSETEQIKSLPLAQCITKFIKDERIDSCARRAAWLGNDEAHYVRKWADKDISDLKLLIRLTCNWIESSVLTTRYRDEMK